MDNSDVRWVGEITLSDSDVSGKKASHLGELHAKGLPVPKFFVLTSNFFEQMVAEFRAEIKQALSSVSDLSSAYSAAKVVKDLLSEISFSEKIREKILSNYKKINSHPDHENMSKVTKQLVTSGRDLPFLAVRASCVEPFPFQMKPVLNVYGIKSLCRALKKLIISVFSPRMVYYYHKKGKDLSGISVPIMVQKMVPAVKSGDMFTINPVKNSKDEIYAQAIWGINNNLLNNPGIFVFKKEDGSVLENKEGRQRKYYTKNGQFGDLLLEPLPDSLARSRILSENELGALSKLAKKLEGLMNFPQHVEWAIDRNSVQILQTRPITDVFDKPLTSTEKGVLINSLTGSGEAVLISSEQDFSDFSEGDIIVFNSENSNLEESRLFPYLVRASGFVYRSSTLTSSVIQACRNFSIPALIKAEVEIPKNCRVQFIEGSFEITPTEQSFSEPSGVSQAPQTTGAYTTSDSEAGAELSNIRNLFEKLEQALNNRAAKEADYRSSEQDVTEGDFKRGQLIYELEWKIRNLKKKLDEFTQ